MVLIFIHLKRWAIVFFIVRRIFFSVKEQNFLILSHHKSYRFSFKWAGNGVKKQVLISEWYWQEYLFFLRILNIDWSSLSNVVWEKRAEVPIIFQGDLSTQILWECPQFSDRSCLKLWTWLPLLYIHLSIHLICQSIKLLPKPLLPTSLDLPQNKSSNALSDAGAFQIT